MNTARSAPVGAVVSPSGGSGKALVAIGTLLVIGGLLTAILGSFGMGGAAMLVGFVVFVVGRLMSP